MTPFEIARLFATGQHAALRAYALQLSVESLAALQPAALEHLGLAASLADDHALAVRLLGLLHQRYPAVAAVQSNLGVACLRGGRAEDALHHLSLAARQLPNDATTALNLGLAAWQLGRPAEAAVPLRRCLALRPDCLEARIYLASCAVAQGDQFESWNLARSLSVAHAAALPLAEQERLAALLLALDRIEEAEQLYRQLIAAVPEEAVYRINLAAILERTLRLEEARTVLEAIPANQRSTPQYLLQWVRASSSATLPQQALAEAWLQASNSAESMAGQRLASELGFEYARVLDGQGRYAEAHDAALHANRLARAALSAALGPAASGIKPAAAALTEHERDAIVAHCRNQPAPGEEPIWLVGFPRSGTTLLDRILNAHPDFEVMEERPAVDCMLLRLEALGCQFGHSAPAIAGHAEVLRAAYWQAVAERMPPRTPGTRLVDKNPLNFMQVHAMLSVFPKASWIFSIRHPCDVVLSCFMQSFRFSNAERGFWSIAESAQIYVDLMSQWLDRRERLSTPCFDLRYEELVAAPEAVLRKLFEFLGVPWRADVLDYRLGLSGSHISTPSYRQVNQPIYQSSVQRWRNYQAFFGTAVEILQPLVLRLGYPSLHTPPTESRT